MPIASSFRSLFLLGLICTCAGAANLALAGAEPASPSPTALHANLDKEKVTICHKGHEITVGASAVPAHLAHGDSRGTCGQNLPPAPGSARQGR